MSGYLNYVGATEEPAPAEEQPKPAPRKKAASENEE